MTVAAGDGTAASVTARRAPSRFGVVNILCAARRGDAGQFDGYVLL
jgi:hypothetical protein